jgi:hypothetical protein
MQFGLTFRLKVSGVTGATGGPPPAATTRVTVGGDTRVTVGGDDRVVVP